MLPGLPRSPPPPPSPVITEQELVGYWRKIPWGRYYDGAAPLSWVTDPSPAACVAFVRNMQTEALAGIPVSERAFPVDTPSTRAVCYNPGGKWRISQGRV
jgi:hypothetical protein